MPTVTKRSSKTKKPPKTAKATASRLKPLAGHKRINVRSLLAIYAVLVLIAAIVAFSVAQSHRHSSVLADPFSSNQRLAAGFTLYYPTKLPKGWQLDKATLASLQQHVISFNALDANGASVTITEQKTPDGFNYNTLYRTFGDRKDTKLPLGLLVTGTIDDGRTHLASLVTKDNTWVLLTTNHRVDQDNLETFYSGLQASKGSD